MDPRFSVIVPCYNQGAFLEEVLQCLRAQTYQPHQVVVVDDGSTDPFTIDEVDRLCVGPIELVRQTNRGLPAARNSGIRQATGDWILPLDCDDLLRADALALYRDAIARKPEIAIWYPDTDHFGLRDFVLRNADFDVWRLLWTNNLVCSSAIRRTVFDAGVTYNEKMRGGYEDWEFWIHACCEEGFRAERLGAPVFRYRQWGYSMLSASNERSTELRAQIQRERPIYSQPQKLLALKTATSPFLAIATESERLEAEAAGQTFADWRIVDSQGRVRSSGELQDFANHPGRFVMLVLDEPKLIAALRADEWFMERIARHLLTVEPVLTWLVDAAGACPGQPVRGAEGSPVAFIMQMRHFFSHRTMPHSGDLAADVTEYVTRTATQPPSILSIQHRDDFVAEMLPATATRVVPVKPRRLNLVRSPDALRKGAHQVTRGLSQIFRAFLSDELHDRLIHLPLARGLLHWVNDPSTKVPRIRPMARKSPLSELAAPVEDAIWQVVHDPPRFATRTEPSVVVVVARMDVAAEAQLLRLLDMRQSDQPHYLVRTDDCAPHPSIRLSSKLATTFSLSGLAGEQGAQGLVDLCDRLNAQTVIFVNVSACLGTPPALRRGGGGRRLLLACLGADGESAMMDSAPRYNNLLDGYFVTDTAMMSQLRRLYVSPAKIQLLSDDTFQAESSPARAAGFE